MSYLIGCLLEQDKGSDKVVLYTAISKLERGFLFLHSFHSGRVNNLYLDFDMYT